MGDPRTSDVRRGRPPAPLVDRTPLDGPQVDLSARLGWLLRIARLSARPGLNLRDLAAEMADDGVGVSESTLSRLETGRIRSAALVAAYERALGLPETSLQGPTDVACRTVGRVHCRDSPEPSMAAYSAAVAPVLEAGPDDPLTAADWLAFVDVVTATDAAMLSRRAVQDVVRRLGSEVRRSVSSALPARYEALSTLRTSRYGHVVLETALELLDGEGAPPQPDLARALGELPSMILFSEAARRLAGASVSALEGWASALEAAKVIGDAPPESWQLLVEPLVEAYQASADHPWRRLNLAYIVRLLPRSLRHEVLKTLRELPDPIRLPSDWTPTRRNEHFTVATELAARVCREVDLPEQPLLARLLFEGLYDPRISRELPAAWMLEALPFAPVLVRHLVDLADSSPDAVTERFVPWLLMRMRTAHAAPLVTGWLRSSERGIVPALLVAYGGGPLSLSDVREHLAAGESQRLRALAALGLVGDPSLPALASGDHRDSSPVVVTTARWVLRDGPRILR